MMGMRIDGKLIRYMGKKNILFASKPRSPLFQFHHEEFYFLLAIINEYICKAG